jgi:hypothetical protein
MPILHEWLSFADERYSTRSARTLRVAYLCGPEPENDLRILTSLGVRVENVWAIESDAKIYQNALARARSLFPGLKIFYGSIERFVRVVRERFDIVYLDFTAPLNSHSQRPFATIHTMFEEQVLAELCALIVNVAEPPADDSSVSFLADYLLPQRFVEGASLGQREEDGTPMERLSDSPITHGFDYKSLTRVVEANLHHAYSAFCTQYPALYANYVQPALRLLRIHDARRRIFAKDPATYKKGVDVATSPEMIEWLLGVGKAPFDSKDWGPGGDAYLIPDNHPLWNMLNSMEARSDKDKVAKAWNAHYRERLLSLDGTSYQPSRMDAVQLGDLLRHVMEGYFPLMSEPVRQMCVRVQHTLLDPDGGLFCDIPFFSLWVQVALNQIGFPYHPVLGKHWRGSYVAKATKMYLDVHVFDQCRPMYDALPALELYEDYFRVIEQQLLCRIGLNAINLQSHWLVPDLYWATALAGHYEEEWSQPEELKPRVDLNISQ